MAPRVCSRPRRTAGGTLPLETHAPTVAGLAQGPPANRPLGWASPRFPACDRLGLAGDAGSRGLGAVEPGVGGYSSHVLPGERRLVPGQARGAGTTGARRGG